MLGWPENIPGKVELANIPREPQKTDYISTKGDSNGLTEKIPEINKPLMLFTIKGTPEELQPKNKILIIDRKPNLKSLKPIQD